MKKLIPYFLALSAFLACTTEPQERTGMDPSLEGKPVTITFSLPNVQLATLSTKSSILDEGVGDITKEPFLDPERLYLVVCGTNHSIKYIRRAKYIKKERVNTADILDYYPISDQTTVPEQVTMYTFQVQLELSDSKRTIHFLGNVDENQLITGMFAYQVLPNLLSYPEKQAYWQRVFLENIHPKEDLTTGEYELDDKGYYVPDDYVTERLQYVPLIRNYAKIQVTNAADREDLDPQNRFHLESYAVIQYPTRGSVVPYRSNTQGEKDDPFSFNVAQTNRLSGYESCDFPTLDETLQYPGNLPSTVAINKDIPTDDMFKNPEGLGKGKVIKYDKTKPDQGFYIYERGVPTASLKPTFVIIRGYFGELSETTTHYYYRLDLMETQQVADESLSQYYPIYRNFRYDIVLNRISNEGVLTPELAAESSTVVDISADISMRHLSDISNGRTRLVVEPFMKRTYTGPSKDGYYTLYARFFNDINSANPNKDAGSVTVELVPMGDDEEDILILYDDDDNPVHGGKSYPRPQWTDDVNGNGVEDADEGGYRVIHFDCKDVKFDVTKTQKIKITGRNLYSTYGELPLYREVEISLQQRQDMEVSCSEKELPLQQGAKQTVSITIPAGLPESMFPLNFIIEAEAKTLTPDNEVDGNNLPVRSGISLSENEKYRGKTTIQFIRTLTLDEYQQKSSGSTCTFDSYFKSNRIESATTVWVEDEDKYFNKKSDTFKNSGLPTHFFYILAKEDNTKVKISSSGLSYKLITSGSEEDDVKWEAYTSNNVIELNTNDKVYFKASSSNIYSWSGGKKFYCYTDDADAKDGKFDVGGYIASLINGETFETNEVKNWVYSNTYSFSEFFKDHTGLNDASDLVLPMTKCFTGCYKSMFENCSGLISGPQNLPATELDTSCYESMFRGCTSLTSIPEGFLSATTTATSCYKSMFERCTALTTPPSSIPFTSVESYACNRMFYGCTSLISAPEFNSLSEVKDFGCSEMFYGCKAMTTPPPILPATKSAASSYKSMFEGCTALTTAPSSISLTTVEDFACSRMFYGCTSLESAPEFSNSLSEVKESGCSEMFYNCTNLQTPPLSLPAGTLGFKAYYRMFWSCSSLKSIPDFPHEDGVEYTLTAGTSAENTKQNGLCFQMFYKCDALTSLEGKKLFNSITPLKLGCFNEMFSNCTHLEKIPADFLPATTSAASCYRSMFEGCTALTTPPSTLPITTVEDFACNKMFFGCTSLESAPNFSDLLTEVKNSGCSEMFYNCTNLQTPPLKLPAGTLGFKAYYKMFWCCSSLLSIPDFPHEDGVEYVLTAASTDENNKQDGMCYQMFYKCDALTSLEGKQLFNSITPLKMGCFNDMFSTCAKLETVPENFLPATKLAQSCYRGMFQACPLLKRAPDLPAETLVTYCYRFMFNGCKSLNYIKCLATNPKNGEFTANWVVNVASSGTFVKNPETNDNSGSDSTKKWPRNNNGIPPNTNKWVAQNPTE